MPQLTQRDLEQSIKSASSKTRVQQNLGITVYALLAGLPYYFLFTKVDQTWLVVLLGIGVLGACTALKNVAEDEGDRHARARVRDRVNDIRFAIARRHDRGQLHDILSALTRLEWESGDYDTSYLRAPTTQAEESEIAWLKEFDALEFARMVAEQPKKFASGEK